MVRILLSLRLGERKMCQAELARRTGIRPNTINELYHEITDRVSLKQIDKICTALNCQVGDLIVQIPDDPQEDCIRRKK